MVRILLLAFNAALNMENPPPKEKAGCMGGWLVFQRGTPQSAVYTVDYVISNNPVKKTDRIIEIVGARGLHHAYF